MMMMKIYDKEMETTTGWKAFTWNMKVTIWMTIDIDGDDCVLGDDDDNNKC